MQFLLLQRPNSGFGPLNSSGIVSVIFKKFSTGANWIRNNEESRHLARGSKGFGDRNDLVVRNSLFRRNEKKENANILHHLCKLLTKHGQRGENKVSEVNQQLALKYGVDHVIPKALLAIRPVIRYIKSKSTRRFYPMALSPQTANAMALRWVVEAAAQRTYGAGGRPCIVRGLFDEFDAILKGTSGLFSKRFATHRNPN